MIVFLISHSKEKTGAHRRINKLIKHMMKKSNEKFIVIGPNQNNITLDKQIIATKIPTNPYSHAFHIFKEVLKNRSKIKRKCRNAKTIITFGETNLLAVLLLKNLLKCTISLGVRSDVIKSANIANTEVSSLKTFIFQVKSKLKLKFIGFCYSRVEQIIVQANNAKEKICKDFKVDEEKVFVLNNNLPTLKKEDQLLYKQRNYKTNPVNLLFVGNPTKIKGFNLLLDIIEKIDSSKTSIKKITLVGINKKDVVNITPKQININALGSRNDVLELMKTHDLLIAPSREDQFPNVVLEAMSLGLPVIGSNIDGIKYMVADEHLLFDPNSQNDALKTIYYTSTEEGYRRAITTIQTRRRKFEFDWEKEYISTVTSNLPIASR